MTVKTPIGVRDLTEGGIFRQLTRLAFPIMGTAFIQMAYNLTDMAWLSRLGSESVAAVGAVGLLVWMTSSFALLTKVAAEISIGQAIGSNRSDEAQSYASHSVTISFLLSLLVVAILYTEAEFIISFFHLNDTISASACDYLRIVCTATPMTFLTLTFSGIYNASGRSAIPFYILTAGLGCNMLLDPLIIFGLGPIRGFGVNGAAWATWISQAIVFLLFVQQMKRRNGILNRFPYFVRLKKTYTIRILQLGTPVALMNFLFASMNLYLAQIAALYGGHIGLTSQATGGQIEGITWNTSQGFSTALGSFVAQNYAAGKYNRMKKAYQYTLTLMLSLGVAVTISFVFFGKEIFGVFIPESQAMIAGGEYLKIVGLSQIFMMLELTTQGMFNGKGHTLPPALVSITLNAARIPLALWLAPIIGVTGVWWAITISSIIKGVILPFWLCKKNLLLNGSLFPPTYKIEQKE